MSSNCCCCFAGSVRYLNLFLCTFVFSCLYANFIHFNLSGVLQREIHPGLRPLEGLESLHESTVWFDRRKRNANFTVDSTNLKDYVESIAKKFDDEDKDGHPILPPQPTTFRPVVTTTPTRRTDRPRVVYITNSPPTKTTEGRTTRGRLRTKTTEAPRTTTEEDDRPVTGFTDDFKPTETPKRRSNGADPEKQTEKTEVYTAPLENRIIRAVIYAAPGIGCLLFLFPAIFLIKRAGVRRVVALALVLAAIASPLGPFLAQFGVYPLIAARFLNGVAFSVVFPAIGSVATDWATMSEQLFFVSFMFLFVTIGPFLVWPLTSLLHSNEVEMLYIHCGFAVLYLITALIFFIFYRDRPQYHPWVNGIELNRIVAGKVHQLQLSRTPSSPFKLLLRSRSAWAIWIAAFSFFTPIALFAIYFPSLLTSQQIFMVENIGLNSAISFAAFPLIFILSGLVNSSSCATSTAHVRIWNTIALAVTACTLILLPISAIFEFFQFYLIPVFLLPLGFIVSGYLRSLVLVGRYYAQHVLAYCGLFFALAYAILPFIVSYLVTQNLIGKWIPVFTFCVAVLLSGTFVFAFLGRGKSASWSEQSWDPLAKSPMKDLQLIDVSRDECGLYEFNRMNSPGKR
ncbi:hypothetical protein WR25_21099 [Diploscapter pachys]|uniref:Major facilitator superfamily (MFS) profile domain-containing protein n=1 Tax=Diploscapter pachys TaxID=2018661 RepID=A0A2A2KF51_9BILA|nr:hypothetical protein WR25_21099 [Diploscapter pachys]